MLVVGRRGCAASVGGARRLRDEARAEGPAEAGLVLRPTPDRSLNGG